jgi:hypothetical protein
MECSMATIGRAEVLMRTYFSTYHLWAAEHFARLAADIESTHTGEPTFNVKHRAYVTNSILSVVSFLEAAINEIFDDLTDGHSGYVDPLTNYSHQLTKLWKEKNRKRWSILDKYQDALLCSGKDAFKKGALPYQDAKILVDLRNDLTHARPQTRASSDVEQQKLRARITAKFNPNRLMEDAANPFFPDHYLGAGCAYWAVKTGKAFAGEFFSRLNIQPNYQKVDFGTP